MSKRENRVNGSAKILGLCLFYMPFLLFILLMLLSFFCSPSAEDLAINYFSYKPGIIAFIKQFYHNEGSRYFSFSLVTILCHGRFILEHYYIVPLALFLSFWAAMYGIINTIARVLRIDLKSISKAWVTTFLCLTFCSVIFEMSSFFYWTSGSITYLPSFIFFLLLLQVLLRSFMPGDFKRFTQYFLCGVLIFCIAGCNEIALYFLMLFLIWAQCIHFSVHKRLGAVLNFLLVIAFFCAFFLILPSGVAHRAGNYGLNFSISKGSLVSLGYTGRIFIKIISSPLSWITMALSFIAGTVTVDPIKRILSGKILFRPIVIILLLALFLLSFYFMISIFSGEMLAPRANNLIIAFSFSVTLLACYSYGFQNNVKFNLEYLFNCTAIRLLILLIIAGSLFVHFTVYNSFTGLIYHKVMKSRIDAIQQALRNGRERVVLHSYSEDFARQSKILLPAEFYPAFKKIIKENDDWMHFQDPVADTNLYIHYYAEYHQIDTIHYLGKDYERIGLIKGRNLE
jgi:hypothetical protein